MNSTRDAHVSFTALYMSLHRQDYRKYCNVYCTIVTPFRFCLLLLCFFPRFSFSSYHFLFPYLRNCLTFFGALSYLFLLSTVTSCSKQKQALRRKLFSLLSFCILHRTHSLSHSLTVGQCALQCALEDNSRQDQCCLNWDSNLSVVWNQKWPIFPSYNKSVVMSATLKVRTFLSNYWWGNCHMMSVNNHKYQGAFRTIQLAWNKHTRFTYSRTFIKPHILRRKAATFVARQETTRM